MLAIQTSNFYIFVLLTVKYVVEQYTENSLLPFHAINGYEKQPKYCIARTVPILIRSSVTIDKVRRVSDSEPYIPFRRKTATAQAAQWLRNGAKQLQNNGSVPSTGNIVLCSRKVQTVS